MRLKSFLALFFDQLKVVVIFIPGSTEKQSIQQSNTKIKPEKGYSTKRYTL